MALVLLEGLDRTGKTTVAKFFESKGYEVVHLKAPGKEFSAGYSYLDAMVDLLQRGASRDLVIDRTHYGELVWPQVYGRKPLLGEEDYEILREIEESIGVKRILMHDPNAEAHWQRCVDNKEPLTKAQFARARSIYATMGQQHGFESVTLPAFCKEFGIDESTIGETTKPAVQQETTDSAPDQTGRTPAKLSSRPADQRQLLEKANAINDILEKRILKKGGTLYDELENDVRTFLNGKLAAIFGNTNNGTSFSPEEIAFFKAMYKRVIEKEN